MPSHTTSKIETPMFNIGKYEVYERLGKGGFATVYRCVDSTNGRTWAVKIGNYPIATELHLLPKDPEDSSPEQNAHLLEWRAYQRLNYGQNEAHAAGIPAVRETGVVKLKEACIHPYLVLELLGQHLGRICGAEPLSDHPNKFIAHAAGMLNALKYMHGQGLVHRDVKPSNFCEAKRGNPYPQVFLLDMGFVEEYSYDDVHAPADFVGTPDYASSAALNGTRQLPIDDLESLGFSLLELWLGDLPWNLTSNASAEAGWTSESLRRMAKKRKTIWGMLCFEGEIPDFIMQWQGYITNLPREQRVDYDYLAALLHKCKLGDASHKRVRDSLSTAASGLVDKRNRCLASVDNGTLEYLLASEE